VSSGLDPRVGKLRTLCWPGKTCAPDVAKRYSGGEPESFRLTDGKILAIACTPLSTHGKVV
jgi:hypothetical protein